MNGAIWPKKKFKIKEMISVNSGATTVLCSFDICRVPQLFMFAWVVQYAVIKKKIQQQQQQQQTTTPQ